MTVFGKSEDRLLTGTGARPYTLLIDGARFYSLRLSSVLLDLVRGYGGLVASRVAELSLSFGLCVS